MGMTRAASSLVPPCGDVGMENSPKVKPCDSWEPSQGPLVPAPTARCFLIRISSPTCISSHNESLFILRWKSALLQSCDWSLVYQQDAQRFARATTSFVTTAVALTSHWLVMESSSVLMDLMKLSVNIVSRLRGLLWWKGCLYSHDNTQVNIALSPPGFRYNFM